MLVLWEAEADALTTMLAQWVVKLLLNDTSKQLLRLLFDVQFFGFAAVFPNDANKRITNQNIVERTHAIAMAISMVSGALPRAQRTRTASDFVQVLRVTLLTTISMLYRSAHRDHFVSDVQAGQEHNDE